MQPPVCLHKCNCEWVRDLHHRTQGFPHYFFHEWAKPYCELGSRSAVFKIVTDVESTVKNMFTAQWWLDLYIIKYKEIPNISCTKTICSRVVCEKLIVTQLVKKVPAFYGTQRFNIGLRLEPNESSPHPWDPF